MRKSQFHHPKTISEYQQLITKLNKRYKGKDFSRDEGIILTHQFMSDIASTIIDLQNRISELEADND